MSAPALEPGVWVEKYRDVPADPDGDNWPSGLGPEVGGVYRVTDVGESFYGIWIELAEFQQADCDGEVVAWPAEEFRPVYRPRADLMQRLLAPVDLVGRPLEAA